jgi:N-acetylglucosaminyldiphosphoundecaprenol N-acetyl-beta-D-mannosaminyltransferase
MSQFKYMKTNILGVEIDKITEAEAVAQVLKWVKSGGKHYIVTPNIEFVMLCQEDSEFRRTLNKADLAIPDSARFGWAEYELKQKSFFDKLIAWPLFLTPKIFKFPVTTGTDLTSELIKESQEKGLTIGFLGGQPKIAVKLLERLKDKYPKLKIGLLLADVQVNTDGEIVAGKEQLQAQELPLDILFVAFGQRKQEKWIIKNLDTFPAKVMIGVGGALDYLSGDVSRAPALMRSLGLEWLYRVILQPWRIKRFGNLVRFIFLVLFG